MRSYGESCGIAHALDIVGDRWAGLVARELLLGPKRFSDLALDLPGASPSVLSDRLRGLTERGVIHQHRAAPPARVQLYELTPWGAQLRPILVALGDWGLGSPSFDQRLPLSDDAAALALSEHFTTDDPTWSATYELRIGRGVFAAYVATGQLDVERGAARRPTAILTTEASAFTQMLGPYPRRPIAPAEAIGELDSLQKLLASVRFPPQAACETRDLLPSLA